MLLRAQISSKVILLILFKILKNTNVSTISQRLNNKLTSGTLTNAKRLRTFIPPTKLW